MTDFASFLSGLLDAFVTAFNLRRTDSGIDLHFKRTRVWQN